MKETNYIYITIPSNIYSTDDPITPYIGRLFKVGYTKHPKIRQAQLHSEARAKELPFYSDLYRMPQMYATSLQTIEKGDTLIVERYVLSKVLRTKGVTSVGGEYFFANPRTIEKCRRNIRRWVREALALLEK